MALFNRAGARYHEDHFALGGKDCPLQRFQEWLFLVKADGNKSAARAGSLYTSY
jgi:hypothetical protein